MRVQLPKATTLRTRAVTLPDGSVSSSARGTQAVESFTRYAEQAPRFAIRDGGSSAARGSCTSACNAPDRSSCQSITISAVRRGL